MPWKGGTNPQAALCRLVFLEKLVRHQTVWEIGGCQLVAKRHVWKFENHLQTHWQKMDEEEKNNQKRAKNKSRSTRIPADSDSSEEKEPPASEKKGELLQKTIMDTVRLRPLTESDWRQPYDLTKRMTGRSTSAGASGRSNSAASSVSKDKDEEKKGGTAEPEQLKSYFQSSHYLEKRYLEPQTEFDVPMCGAGGHPLHPRKEPAKKGEIRKGEIQDENSDDDDGVDDVEQDELETDDGTMYYSSNQKQKAASAAQTRRGQKNDKNASEGGKAQQKQTSRQSVTTVPSKRKAVGKEDVEDDGSAESEKDGESGSDEDISLSPMVIEESQVQTAALKSLVKHWNVAAKHFLAIKDDYRKLLESQDRHEVVDPDSKVMDSIIRYSACA
jgi:hypothetical protein